MKQTYSIQQDGIGTYHFYGITTQEDGGTSGREYASGSDLERVREAGVAEMSAETLRMQSTIVEDGALEEAQAKVQAAGSDVLAIQRRALAKLTTEEADALGFPRISPPAKE